MATPVKFKNILHSRPWIQKSPHPSTTAYNGGHMRTSRTFDQRMYHVTGTSAMFGYNPNTDAWFTIAGPSLGSYGSGGSMECSAIGPTGTATAGSTTTLTTNLTLAYDLRGYEILITGGPGAGDVRTIASNTIGTNGVITVTSAFSATITTSSTYILRTGSAYIFGGGTLAASSFRKYDYATNAFSSLSITGLPASFGTDGYLIGTPSIIRRGVVTSNATGTATAGGASTLTNSGKAWATNQWANAYQVRITAGTGLGQTRIIASNTGTALTTTAAWTTNPDATSVYSIEGNDDYLWLIGNGNVTMYRYQISNNTWTTVTPGVARSGAPSTSCLSWHASQSTETDWTTENSIINGRRIYSLRGGGVTTLDYFDIPTLSWTSAISYGPAVATPANGWKVQPYGGKAYIRNACTAITTCQLYVFDPARATLDGFGTQPLICAQNPLYNSCEVAEYVDGADIIPFFYTLVESSTLNSPWLRTPLF
mgnify:CR=1 FL=1